MKSIIVYDSLCPKGHVNLNNHIVRLLSYSYNVIIISKRNYYTAFDNVEIKPFPFWDYKGKKINGYRLKILLNFFLSIFRVWKASSDTILVMTSNPRHIKYQINLFGKKNVYLFHHNDVDQLLEKKTKTIFDEYSNKVKHIVFAPYIKSFLLDLGVSKENIYILPHPLNYPKESLNGTNVEKIILSIGQANDDEFISRIVNHEKEHRLLESSGYQLVVRSNSNINTEGLTSILQIRGYLSDLDYMNLYKKAQIVIVPYGCNYKYRYSGVAIDALSFGKLVVGPNNQIMKYFSEIYPNNCRIYHDIDGLFTLLIDSNYQVSQQELTSFWSSHSDDNIIHVLKSIIA